MTLLFSRPRYHLERGGGRTLHDPVRRALSAQSVAPYVEEFMARENRVAAVR